MSDGQDHDAEPQLVAVYLTSGVRTSAGPGPGVRHVPPAEAAQLVNRRVAVHGDRPPRGYLDGGAPPGLDTGRLAT